MKNIKLFALLIVVALLLASCGSTNIINNDTTADTSDESTVDTMTSQIETNRPLDSDADCPVHAIESGYSTISGSLIDRIGAEKVESWANEHKRTENTPVRADGCTCFWTFGEFVDYFDIDSLTLLNDYYLSANYYVAIWDVDAVIKRDWEGFDVFAQNKEEISAEALRREKERNLKLSILDYLKKNNLDYYNDLTDNGENAHLGFWSIPEVVYNGGISVDEIKNLITEDETTYVYDFDRILNDEDHIKESMDALYPIQVDEMLRVSAPESN